MHVLRMDIKRNLNSTQGPSLTYQPYQLEEQRNANNVPTFYSNWRGCIQFKLSAAAHLLQDWVSGLAFARPQLLFIVYLLAIYCHFYYPETETSD